MMFRTVLAALGALALAACQTTPSTPSLAANGGAVAGASCGGVQGGIGTPANATEPKSGRKFYLEYPCDLKPHEPVTLLLNLHGGGSAGAWQRLYFPAGDLAAKHRLVVATPTAAGGAPFRMWLPDADDQHLRDLTDLMISSFSAANIKSFWLVGHSQGGMTSARIVCSDYFAPRADGFLSLAGGRVGMRFGGTPTCDYSHIFETGDRDTAGVAGIPATSPLADRFKCKAKTRLADVVDTEPGKVYDPRGLTDRAPRAGWGGKPGPGTAEIYTFPDCADGRVVADVIRFQKGHTEGLEPKITETLVTMMQSAAGGKVQRLAATK